MNPSLNIFVALDANKVDVQTHLHGIENQSNALYTYRLKKDGQIVSEVKKIPQSQFSFTLSEYGQYWVQVACFIDKTELWKNSKFVFYSRLCQDEYRDFLKMTDTKNLGELPYFEPSYPHQDFCVFHSDSLNSWASGIESLAKERAMLSHDFVLGATSVCRLLTHRPMQAVNNLSFSFSGVTRTKDHLIIGDQDIIRHQVDPRELQNQIGDFFLIYQENDQLYILHDYLGLSKVYYYQSGEQFIASNRYHLLLLALKSVGILPKPRKDRLIADLSSVSAFARLNYSRKMLMENTFVMTSDKSLILNQTGALFVENELHKELYDPEPYDEGTYQQQLQAGVNEMLDNMKIALEYPGTDYFKVDLSGGLDSRMIMALLTNFPEYHKQIQVHALDLPNYPKDLSTALALNSMFDYPYATFPMRIKPILKKTSYEGILSGYFCINQQPMPAATETSYCDNVIDMPGLLGELVFRPHMYTKFKGTPEEDCISVDEFVDKREYYHLEAVSKEGMPYYTKYLKDELADMPGNTPMAKLQNHYLMYMDSIHHATYYTSSNAHVVQWTPLASKTIFHLNNVSGMVFRSNKLAYDLMRMLNPAMAAIPYEKNLYNNELVSLSHTDPRYAHTLKIADECIEAQRTKWELAHKVQTDNATYVAIDSETKRSINEENAKFFDTIKEDALFALKKIVQYDESIGNIVGLDCFSRMCGNADIPGNERYMKFLFTKLLTIYHALRMFGYLD